MKVMIRRVSGGLSVYVPKKDVEETIVDMQHEQLWGGWIRLSNGWLLELPAMSPQTEPPITVNAKVLSGEVC